MEKKAFRNWEPGRVHLNFPNGNSISSVWADGTYTENYDSHDVMNWLLSENTNKNKRPPVIESDTVEIMFDCGERLEKRILKKYDENPGGEQPLGYLTMQQWSEIVHLLATEKKV